MGPCASAAWDSIRTTWKRSAPNWRDARRSPPQRCSNPASPSPPTNRVEDRKTRSGRTWKSAGNGARFRVARYLQQLLFQPIAFVFRFPFALIGNHARVGGRYTGSTSATPRFLRSVKAFFLAFLHLTGSFLRCISLPE